MAPAALTDRFQDAFAYAARHFDGKVRRNTRVPAIAHAMAVSALVLDMGGSESEAIAALLHDVVEDGGGPDAVAWIEASWGAEVAGLVLECTDEIEPSGRPWAECKAGYLARMPSSSAAALRISLADKADNTRTLLRDLQDEGDALFARHTAGDRETLLWYYESLVQQFDARRTDLGPAAGSMLRELHNIVALLRTRSR